MLERPRERALGHELLVISPDQYASIPCPSYPEIRLALTTRFGIGARTGDTYYDEHRVDNVLLVAGSEHDPRPVAVEVASNGQQFSTSVVPFMYNAPPVVSAFYPERGPQTGSTVVRVLGANFGAGAHYMCRFDGITVDASYDVANSTIHCTSVPRATARATAGAPIAQHSTSTLGGTVLPRQHLRRRRRGALGLDAGFVHPACVEIADLLAS